MNKLGEALRNGFQIAEKLAIWEWAKKNIVLPQGGYAIPGSFYVDKSRHLIDPFRALQNAETREINILKATQTGGTLVCDIFVPWVVLNQPGPILWSFQTEQVAKQHAETRLFQVIENCKALANVMPEDRHKSRDQSILFRNGIPLYIQGPSVANLQSKSIRYKINDEVWIWKPGIMAEAKARVSAYYELGMSKNVNISQGGTKGDEWQAASSAGVLAQWQVPCVHCNAYFTPLWVHKLGDNDYAGMTWDDGGKNVRYECPNCRQSMVQTERLKAQWNQLGRYSADVLCGKKTQRSIGTRFHSRAGLSWLINT